MQFIRKKGTIFKMIFILYQLGIVHEQLFLTTLNKGLIRIEAVVLKCTKMFDKVLTEAATEGVL